jgi:hypothetical protein
VTSKRTRAYDLVRPRTRRRPVTRPARNARRATRIGAGVFCGLILAISQPARAQEAPPIDTVTRAAYCIPVAQGAAKQSNDFVAEAEAEHAKAVSEGDRNRLEQMAKVERANASVVRSVLKQLRSYLSSRGSQMDQSALRAANAQGEADWKASSEMLRCAAKQCPYDLLKLRPSDGGACIAACGWDVSLMTRTDACLTPTWLPSWDMTRKDPGP